MNALNLAVRGVMLGIGLAMDAFSISLVNGLRDPQMKRGKAVRIAGVFAVFQTGMPLLGWILVHTVITAFHAAEAAVPWIGFVILSFIGGKMLLEGLKKEEHEHAEAETSLGNLLVQGVATSIDALSAGLTMAELSVLPAMAEAALIGGVTFVICMAGIRIGKKAGSLLADKASVLGGVILIGIGLHMLLSHLL